MNLLLTLLWLVVVTLLRWDWQLSLVLLWLGGIIGTFLLDSDQLLGIFLKTRLSFHNVLTQVFLFILCFWVLTSTNSLLAKGMVMAASLHLLRDEVLLLLSGQEDFFRQNFFWQIKKELSSEQLKIYVITMAFVFIVLSLFLI